MTQPMNDRERFRAHMTYQPVDRPPLMDFSFWPETIERWKQEGLPDSVPAQGYHSKQSRFFGMDPMPAGVGGQPELCPPFEHKVLEDLGDEVIVQQADGVRVRQHKKMSSIPMHEGHLLETREDWEKHYKPRLDPDHPDRFPDGWDAPEKVAHWRDTSRPDLLGCFTGSLFGRIRDWLGLEGVSFCVFDEPDWFEEMVVTLADLQVARLQKLVDRGAKLDALMFWEDMCYNAGPLLQPEYFKKYLVPQYKRITAFADPLDVPVVWVDCDGKIDDLVPLWLEAGVNCMFPMEIGSWKADPIKFRNEYGKDLLMMGGFDKRILAQTPEDISAEIRRLDPLVQEGGFIPFCDHRVPPDVPLSNYVHYCQEARDVWCHGVNLKPMGEIERIETPA